MPVYDERQFTAELKSWVDTYIQDNPESLFSRCETEEEVNGYRSDFTLYRKRSAKPALMGEVKLPDAIDGDSPYNRDVIKNAFLKASIKGAKFYFTWNINKLVLWKTQDKEKPLFECDQETYNFPKPVWNRYELSDPKVLESIRLFFLDFLNKYNQLYQKKRDYYPKPIDRRIIETIENLLEWPVQRAAEELINKWDKDVKFRLRLHDWMRDEAGYAVTDKTINDDLRDSAKLGSYLLMLKVGFYNHLRRTFSDLPPINVPDDLESAPGLKELLKTRFNLAMEITGDYENIFEPSVGDEVALCTDEAVRGWRNLMRHFDDCDFSRFDHDVIGNLYEGLLSTHERHQYGQHFTRTEIVDLINAFCIRNAKDKVLDPACGGGTFLVRAYARKKLLSKDGRGHQDLLKEIYGIDSEKLPAELSTINLAVRELVREKNYPLVAKDDFFDVQPKDSPFARLVETNALGAKEAIKVEMPAFDAIVGNPPYIRQEDLGTDGKKKILESLSKDYPRGTPRFSGRSDIYVYFWPHAARMLKDGGYIGFITSTHWLDSDYGFKLQKYLLENFKIIAIIESAVEPLFSVARIRTVVTIVQKWKDEGARNRNLVRFVRIFKPMQEFLSAYHTDSLKACEKIAKEIELTTSNFRNPLMRVRVVSQGDLVKEGTTKGTLEYQGAKWGIHLRAPDVYFKIIDKGARCLVPLGEIADIKFGIKSGADDFFFPRDITDDLNSTELAEYGLTKGKTRKYRVIRAGDKSTHVVESVFVKPVAFNLMEISKIEFTSDQAKRRLILIDRDIHGSIKRKKVWKYIKWGESKDFHTRPTCASRVKPKEDRGKGKEREWYELRPTPPGDLFWSMTHQYRHIIPTNKEGMHCNHRLFDITTDKDKTILAGILNSNVQVLFKNLFGRTSNEGKLDTEVVDVKMMLTVAPGYVGSKGRKEIESILEEIKSEEIGQVKEEVFNKKRRRIDELLLAAIGFDKKPEREETLEALYAYLIEHQEREREWEVQAVRKRTEGKKRQRVTPKHMAEEIWGVEKKSEDIHFEITEHLAPGIPCLKVFIPQGVEVRQGDMFDGGLEDGRRIAVIGDESIELPSPYHSALLETLANIGIHGELKIPISKEKAEELLSKAEKHTKKAHSILKRAVEDRIRDKKFRAKVLYELIRIYRIEG